MKLTVAQARRIAVRAQRLDTRRATAPLTLLRHLGAIQIDSVNVVARAHYLPFYSRLTASQADVDHFSTLAPPPSTGRTKPASWQWQTAICSAGACALGGSTPGGT